MPKPTPASIRMVKQRTQKARSRARVRPRTRRPLSEILDHFAIYALVIGIISKKRQGHGQIVLVVLCIPRIIPMMRVYIVLEYQCPIPLGYLTYTFSMIYLCVLALVALSPSGCRSITVGTNTLASGYDSSFEQLLLERRLALRLRQAFVLKGFYARIAIVGLLTLRFRF